MPCQLPADCLSEIFGYLEKDKITLHSCLLVNRLWCETSVRILWRNIWSFKYSVDYSHRSRVNKAIFSTLIACLPNESKEILYNLKVGLLQEAITLKPPLFNYAAFCKVLSIYEIGLIIDNVFKSEQSTQSTSLSLYRNYLIAKEITKMIMNQIPSLKRLVFYSHYTSNNMSFIDFPGTGDRLADLSELCCSSNIYPEFFYQLSQVCHNLQSLTIYFEDKISNGLKELISLQNNLKNLNLFDYSYHNYIGGWAPAFIKHSNTLRKLHIYGYSNDTPLSFVSSFLNLQEIKFSLIEGINSEDFKKLQNVTFPKLEILKIPYHCPEPRYMKKFLKNNGKYLKELHMDDNNDYLGLSIVKFCPNIRKLSVKLNNNELKLLKTIFSSCKYLESIRVWCGGEYLIEKEVLEAVAIHSPENFYELKICHDSLPELFLENLELFFISWNNRASKKLFTLIIISDNHHLGEEDIKMIKKYMNLGVINFEIKGLHYEQEVEENEDKFFLHYFA